MEDVLKVKVSRTVAGEEEEKDLAVFKQPPDWALNLLVAWVRGLMGVINASPGPNI